MTIFAAGNNNHYLFRVCVCSLRYPARKAHAPYYIENCGLSGCAIFPHYLTNCKVFGQKVFKIKMCVWIFLQFSAEMFLILRRNRRDIVINVYRLSCIVSIILIKLKKKTFYFFLQIFEKKIKYEMSWKTAQWEPSCWMGTGRYDEDKCLFSQNYLCIHFVHCF